MADTYTETLDKRQMSLLRLAEDMIRSIANPAITDSLDAAVKAIKLSDDPTTPSQMNKFKAEIASVYNETMTESLEPLTEQLTELGLLEAAFTAKTIESFVDVSLKVPADKKVKKYIENAIMDLGTSTGGKSSIFTYKEYIKSYTDSSSDSVANAIYAEWVAQNNTGKLPTLNQYVKRVQVVAEGANKKNVKTLVKTAVNHYSMQARLSLRDDNLDVIDREVPSTTFDTKRSKICTSIQGKYGIKGWPAGKSPIGYNPYHPSCRTQVLLLAKGQSLEGDRAAIKGRKGENARDNFEARKARLRTKSKTSYQGRKDEAFIADEINAATPVSKFLRDQPDWYIKESLGQTIGQAFIDGKVQLDQLTDDKLRPLTIKELGLD